MTNDFENELDAIRGELYEQTKDMVSAEAVKTINNRIVSAIESTIL